MSATYLHGDCLEVMKTLPDKSVDCFVCDLPYGCLHPEKKDEDLWWDRKSLTNCPWDVKIDLEKFWTEVKRLAKTDNTPVIHFCNTKFGIELINSNPKWFRYDLVWDKQKCSGFLDANRKPLSSHEMIYLFSKKSPYYKRIDYNDTSDGKRCPVSVLQFKKVGAFKNRHPTEKPKELYKWLLERYCPAEGTVLDPTAGSFNSIVVAKELGLKGIGIEMDEGFYKKAMERATPTTDTTPHEEKGLTLE